MRILCACFLLSFSFSLYSQECFEAGKQEMVPAAPPEMSGYEYGFNPKQTAYIVDSNNFSVQSDEVQIYDLKTRKIKKFPKDLSGSASWNEKGDLIIQSSPPIPDGVNYEEFIDNTPEKFLDILKKTSLSIIDIKTGARKEIKGKFPDPITGDLVEPISIEGQKGSRVILLKNEKGELIRENMLSRKNSLLREYKTKNEVTLDPTGALKVFRGNALIYEASIKDKIDLANINYYSASGSSPNQNYFMIATPDSLADPYNAGIADQQHKKYLIIDIKNKAQKVVELPKDFSPSGFNKKNFSADGNLVLLKNQYPNKNGTFLFDLKKGEARKISDTDLVNPAFDEKNNICGINMNGFAGSNPYLNGNMNGIAAVPPTPPKEIRPSTYDCISMSTGEKVSSQYVTKDKSAFIRDLGENTFVITPFIQAASLEDLYQKRVSYLYQPETICPQTIKFADCNCNPTITPKFNLSSLLKINLELVCQNDFNEDSWKTLTQRPIEKLDDQSSLIWLKRFSKPKGFNPKIDMDVMKSMILAKVYLKFPAEFKAALGGVLHSSSVLYDDLLSKYPPLSNISALSPAQDCVTENEKKELDKSKRELMEDKLSKLQVPSAENIRSITELAKEFLTHDQKDKLAEEIADKVVTKMDLDPDLKGIFPSKIYKFAYNQAKEMLGIDHKKLTDLTTVRNGGELSFIELGVGPFSGSKEALGGIHLKAVSKEFENQFKPETTTLKTISWEHDGKSYNAKVEIKRESIKSDITPANLSPNYKEMKKDRPFKGLIVVGTNLGPNLTETVVQQYLEYYSNQGFDIQEAVEIKDLPDFLKSRISGDEQAHYFVKEAHSDGDEKNLFRINKMGKLLQGTKIVDGKKEIIEIIYPGKDPASVLLPNQDFGQWMRDREAKSGQELIYLNSSCWSITKASLEIASARTAKLINIPTTTSMTTFVNNDKNVMYSAINGIRNEKTYAEIREDMNKDTEYKKRTSNVMIFPDSKEYQDYIRYLMKMPLEIDTKLFVQKTNGLAPYSIEE